MSDEENKKLDSMEQKDPETKDLTEDTEEVTEDDVPETKEHVHNSRHARKNVARQKQSVGMWQFLTVLFAGLFVISLFTGAFDFVKSDVNGNTVSDDAMASNVALLAELESDAAAIDADSEDIKVLEEDIILLGDLIEMADQDMQDSQDDIDELVTEIRAAIAGYGSPDDTVDDPAETPDEPTEDTDTEVVGTVETATLDFYVMSQCPFGLQVENAIAPVLETLGDSVDFNLYFIVTDNEDGTFRSLHGEPEVQGNIVQLCAIEYEPESYMDLIVCMNENVQGIPDNWETCAEDLGLDVDSIKECYEGDEGTDLLKESIVATNLVGATGSPTIYLNGERYSGGRSEMDFTRAICNALDNGPTACQELPEAVAVKVIILNDERCGTNCDISRLISQLESIFPGMDLTELDYSSDEGQAIYGATGVQLLPAIFFDETVEGAEGYQNVLSYLLEAGDYTSLRIGAQFDPTKEVCDNGVDDTGNGDVDCDDADCKDSLVCREEIENHLQVFIMSDCPYGRIAVEALDGVLENFEDDVDYEIHYIATENGDGFDSLHGQYEVDENIIQLCVLEHSPDVWFDYVLCRSTNGVRNIDWNTCAEETGIDVDAVQTCFDDGTGADLLREDIKIAQSLGVSASPTWFANNKVQFSGIDAETVKTSFCISNPDKEGCENMLSDDTGGVAEGSC